MTRRKERECTGIDHTKPLHAIHAGLRVDHGHFVVGSTHLAGASSVPQSHDVVLNELENLVIRLHVLSGVVLLADHDGCHGLALEGRAHALEHGNCDLLVGRIAEPVRVDDGQVGGVRGLQGDVTARKGRDQHAEHGGILVAVLGLVSQEVRDIADVACSGDVL